MMGNNMCWQGGFSESTVYQPAVRPGFVAWANAFSFGNGEIGLAFDEVLQRKNPRFVPPRLEFGEAAGVPVSYCSVECGDETLSAYRVYMRSTDGIHFTETGRCQREAGSFCHVGFPDGRMLGFDVPRRNEKGDGWADYLRVSESTDGGRTWRVIRHLLEGTAPYLWRVRRLKNGEILVLASFYGTPWGPGNIRATRNTMLPGETYVNKIQTFFLTSPDGIHFSPPRYILPGIGAHEYDAAETDENTLLFIAGDVQGTPVGRQFVRKTQDGWINGPLLPIGQGAPVRPKEDPQGGFVPEALVREEKTGMLIGFRRGKGYALSADQGENWTKIEMPGMDALPYQPVMLTLPDGRIALYGHLGGDNAFGEKDMRIVTHVLSLRPDACLPRCGTLTLEREKDPENKKYRNAFRARLQSGGRPLMGKTVVFRFQPFWKKDGSVNTLPQQEASFQVSAVTDEQGVARAEAPWFDHRADIHLAYNADAVFAGDAEYAPCAGPLMTVLALTPERNDPYPYDAYFAGGVLYLAPQLIRDFPELLPRLTEQIGDSPLLMKETLPPEALRRLQKAGVLEKSGEDWAWIASVHAPRPLHGVKEMPSGDHYI